MRFPLNKTHEFNEIYEGLLQKSWNALTNMGRALNASPMEKRTNLQKNIADPIHQRYLDKYSTPLVFRVLDMATAGPIIPGRSITGKSLRKLYTVDEIMELLKSGKFTEDTIISPYDKVTRMPWKRVKDWEPFKSADIEPENKIYDKTYYIKTDGGHTYKLDIATLAKHLKDGYFNPSEISIWYDGIPPVNGKPYYVRYDSAHPDKGEIDRVKLSIP